MAEQIPLNVKLPDTATFENFFPGANSAILEFLSAGTPAEFLVYLYGAPGSGRTHLLQACCKSLAAKPCIYIDLSERDLSTELLKSLENFHLICLDNIDCVFGNNIWERALFNFYNEAQQKGAHLLIAGKTPPAQSQCQLLDLRSRLSAGFILQLRTMNDAQKIKALQKRAQNRGLILSEECAQFLLNHYPRDTHALFSVLNVLDHASLVNQHRLTIPFIKQTLCSFFDQLESEKN